jgi:hypothetical protein
MPPCPTPAQSAASRNNGARATGPRSTGRSRLNARAHGYTASIRPPDDPVDRQLFDDILSVTYQEFLPCGPAEMLAIEEIAALECRRIRIQETLLAAFDFADEAALKRLQLLSRYETDTLNKLDKKRKYLHELQAGRAQRRSLALEAALVADRLQSLRATARQQARVMADRALSREMVDLALQPDQQETARRAVLGSGSFRNDSPADTGAAGAPVFEPVEGVPDRLPGPPWDPWRGASVQQLDEWNERLIQHRIEKLRQEIADLEGATEPPEELVRIAAQRNEPLPGSDAA